MLMLVLVLVSEAVRMRGNVGRGGIVDRVWVGVAKRGGKVR
jgi:hypothetical protein